MRPTSQSYRCSVIVAAAFVLGVTATLHAQPVIDVQRPPGVSLAVEETFDKGLVEEPQQLSYVVVNEGDAPLELEISLRSPFTEPTDGTLQTFEEATLRPGKSTTVEFELDPLSRRFRLTLRIDSNDPQRPRYDLLHTGATRLSGSYFMETVLSPSGRRFGGFGELFDHLEEFGTAGPVEVSVLPGLYESNESYALGVPRDARTPFADQQLPNRESVAAIEAMPIRIVGPPAPRFKPRFRALVEGDGLHYPRFGGGVSGAMVISVANVYMENIEFTNATNFGLLLTGRIGGSFGNVTIRDCRFDNISQGPGLAARFDDALHGRNIVFENCIVWNCGGGRAFDDWIYGMIAMRNVTADSVIRHCAILATDSLAEGMPAVSFQSSHTRPSMPSFINNIVVMQTPRRAVFNVGPLAELQTVDANIYYFDTDEPGPFATEHDVPVPGMEDPPPLGTVRNKTFESWQAEGFDAQSMVTAPLVFDITADPPDFRLQHASPAIGAGLPNPLDNDIFGSRRVDRWDIGPYQFFRTSMPGMISLRHGDQRILPGRTYRDPRRTELNTPTRLSYRAVNIGQTPINVTDLQVTGTLNAQARIVGETTASLEPGEHLAFDVEVRAFEDVWCVDIELPGDPHFLAVRSPYPIRILGRAEKKLAILGAHHHPEFVPPTDESEISLGFDVPLADGAVLDLGEQPVQEETYVAVSLADLGRVALEVLPLLFEDAENVEFEGLIETPPTDAPEEFRYLVVLRLTPQEPGPFTLTVRIPNNSSNAPDYTVTLRGQATGDAPPPGDKASAAASSTSANSCAAPPHPASAATASMLLLCLLILLARVRRTA